MREPLCWGNFCVPSRQIFHCFSFVQPCFLLPQDWQLQIKFVQLKDAGSYECAVSSHPSISLFVQLHVTESKAKIVGPPERYLKPGSTLRLTCKILDNIENPQFIFWYHNTRMVNYDSHLGINVTVQLGKNCWNLKFNWLFHEQLGKVLNIIFHSSSYRIPTFLDKRRSEQITSSRSF